MGPGENAAVKEDFAGGEVVELVVVVVVHEEDVGLTPGIDKFGSTISLNEAVEAVFSLSAVRKEIQEFRVFVLR